ETPCSRPRSFTRSMNAGGNEYSRPQSSPTFTLPPPLSRGSGLIPAYRSGLKAQGGARRDGLRNQGVMRRKPISVALPRAGLVDEPAHDRAQVAGVAIHLQLAIGARPLSQNCAHVLRRLAASQLVEHILEEVEQLDREIAHWHLLAAAEINQLTVDPPARRPPLVLLDERAGINPEPQVILAHAIHLHHDGLGERGERDRHARRRRHVADAEFERAERRVRPQVPPQLLPVVDATQIDEQLQIFLVLVPGIE